MLQLASSGPAPRVRAPRLPVHARKAILDATRELLRDLSFSELELQSVARLAGTSRRTIHNHFECKEDLYRASREELIFDLARNTIDTVPERMEPVDGMRYIAAAAFDTFSNPANHDLNASIARDGRRFAWLPKSYDRHVVTPLVQACEVFIMHVCRRRDLPEGHARAIAEQFLIFIDALSSGSSYLRQRVERLAISSDQQLDIAARAFAAVFSGPQQSK